MLSMTLSRTAGANDRNHVPESHQVPLGSVLSQISNRPAYIRRMATRIGIITAGGDSPGLNVAIRGIGKAALACGMEIIGFRDGFRGLAEDSRLRPV
jgi:hypothetical protein